MKERDGIRCRHTFMPFYKGMKNHQPQYDSEENKKRYDLEQKKRAAERKIRETKKEYENAKHARKEAESKGLTDLAEQLKQEEDALKKKFESQYDEYGKFCAQNGLKRSDERLFVGKSYSGYKDWPEKNGLEIPKDVKFNASKDPIRKYIGSAEDSHPEELNEINSDIENSGARIERRQGTMAYSPGLHPGKPGTVYVEPGASISAWRHEHQHFKDDREDGYLGFRVFEDLEKCRKRETDAYQVEIDFAQELGYNDVVEELIKLREEELKNYE